MRFWISGPRLLGGLIRPGVSFGPSDFRRARPATVSSADFVYVVAGEHGLIKVGFTTNPQARLATLRTASPYSLEMVFCAPAYGSAFVIEQAAHDILSKHRASGEWFAVTPEMAIAAIYAAADRSGRSLLSPVAPAAPAPTGWWRLPVIARVAILAAGYALADALFVPGQFWGLFSVAWLIGGVILMK